VPNQLAGLQQIADILGSDPVGIDQPRIDSIINCLERKVSRKKPLQNTFSISISIPRPKNGIDCREVYGTASI
jgi:hypothetical protein